MLLPPPENADPARAFRELLAPIVTRSIGRPLSVCGDELFVRAIGSYDWVRLHRAIVSAGPNDRPRAENVLAATVVVDREGRPTFEADDFDALYQSERVAIVRAASDALIAMSPTMASHDLGRWLDFLESGASAPENLSDTLSLGQCRTVAYGFGRGQFSVRHEPESYYGIPRRALVDAQWLAYYAAARVCARSNG